MQELEKKYTIQYLFPEHKRDYHHWQAKGRIIWVEWAHKFAKEVAKKKWNRKNVLVRLHRYELDTTYMNEINWDNVDQLIFVNPELEKDFKENINGNVETTTIPNAIDVSKFPYNLSTQENLLLAYSVNFDIRKGYDQLIVIFSKIVEKNPFIQLTIAAQHPVKNEMKFYYNECKLLITNYGLQEKVKLHIIKNDLEILELLKNHNAIVSYSTSESFHYSFAEGLLSGLEGFCKNWQKFNLDYFWNEWCYDNEQDFINAILKWSKSPLEDRIYKSKKNREYIINNYSSKRISSDYKNLFNRL